MSAFHPFRTFSGMSAFDPLRTSAAAANFRTRSSGGEEAGEAKASGKAGGRIAMIGLVLATIAYNVCIGFMIWFTIAFFGVKDLLEPSLGAAIFWLFAASPLVMTAYYMKTVMAGKPVEKPD